MRLVRQDVRPHQSGPKAALSRIGRASCGLLQADEAMWAGDKAAEGRLKGLITSKIQMIESKGVDPIRMENRVRVIMTSNEDWVVPATGDERRFFVLDVASYARRNNVYFAELYEELDNGGRARLLHELLSFDLSRFDVFRVPQTKALLDQKLRSLDPIDDCWFNRLWAGTLLQDDDFWRRLVVRDDLYSEYLKDAARMGVGRKRSCAEFGKRLKKLAPGIDDTRPGVERGGVVNEGTATIFPHCRSVGSPLSGLWARLSTGLRFRRGRASERRIRSTTPLPSKWAGRREPLRPH
ncbi:hypothetical protein ACVME8_008793 [Bradyrhizobium diazoefficiens]